MPGTENDLRRVHSIFSIHLSGRKTDDSRFPIEKGVMQELVHVIPYFIRLKSVIGSNCCTSSFILQVCMYALIL